MPEVVRLSTGYEVEFSFDSDKWKDELEHLANAIIGERLQRYGRSAPDEPTSGTRSTPLEEEFLEEIRYVVATADDVFKHALLGFVIRDAVNTAYRSAIEAVEAEESAQAARKKARPRRRTRKTS